LVKSTLLIVNS